MTRQAQVASARPTRTPLGQRNRLAIRNKEKGYHYRIVNANLEKDPDRIQAFTDAGWEVVPAAAVGSVGDKRVDDPSALGSASSVSVGQGTKAVVMRIKDEWYKEDQAYKQQQVNESESTMYEQARSKGLGLGDLRLNARPDE